MTLMHIDQRKEQYSFAYIRAVAAAAGYGVNEASVDDDSIDLQIASRSTIGTVKRPRLELQAKCLGDDTFNGDDFGYSLSLKNYDDLRDPDVQVPRILVVVRAPNDDESWLGGDDDGLLVRHCAYWFSLRGLPDHVSDAEKPTKTVRLPREQRFDVAGLRAIMDRIGTGALP